MSDEREHGRADPRDRLATYSARPFTALSLERVRALLGGRYDVIREVGAGGTSIVFLAHDRERACDVAIKVLRPELSIAVLAARFLREVDIGQQLLHENVLPIYESGVAEGELYFTMPYVGGETLRQRLTRETHLSMDDAFRIARAVANALDHAHGAGLIHRDIKPANILLDGDRVLVADFGVARAMSVAATTELTETGLVIGTAAYMSPEQGSGERQLDGRTDVYSLGCVVYEMLGGEPPFTGPTARAIIARHHQEEPRSLRVIRPAVTDAMQRAVGKALAKVPSDRFSTAGAFVNALFAAASAAAADESWWRRVRSRARKHPTLALVSGLILAAGGWGMVRHRSTEKPRGPLALAIRPLRQVGDSGRFGWLAAALESRLAGTLHSAPDLVLRSPLVVAEYAARAVSNDSLQRLLGADFLIDGNIIVSGDSVQIAIELTDAKSANLIASKVITQSVTAPAEQILDAVSSQIGVTILPVLGKRVRAETWENAARDSAAARLRYDAQERRWAGEALFATDPKAAARELAAADSLLALSAQAAPRWQEPRLARADLAARRVVTERGFADTTSIFRILEKGLLATQSVLRDDPTSADALALQGRLKWRRYQFEWSKGEANGQLLASAEADLRRAIAFKPSLARAAQDLSEILYFVRARFAEANQLATQAFELDAYLDEAGLLINRIALTFLHLGRDTEAGNWCSVGLRRYPDQPYHLACLLEVMAWGTLKPSPDSANAVYHRLVARQPEATVRWHYLLRVAAVHARAGNRREAESLLEQVRREMARAGTDRGDMLPWEAGVYFRLGDSAEGERLFAKYLTLGRGDAAVRANGFPLRGFVAPRASTAP